MAGTIPDTYKCYVLFEVAPKRRANLSLWLRNRRRKYVLHLLAVWLVEKLTGNELVHCSFCDGAVVENVTLSGTRYQWFLVHLASRPRLAWMIEVDTPSQPVIDITAQSEPFTVGRTLIRWLTGRGVHSQDCVAATVRQIRATGKEVPDVVTPAQLYDWCRSEGGRIHELAVLAD